jgi:hypothetical protein
MCVYLANKSNFIIKECRVMQHIQNMGYVSSPSHVQRRESGSLLHKRIVGEIALQGGACIGIDIDHAVIDYLQEKMPQSDLAIDAHQHDREFCAEFNIVVACDVIEHLPNPEFFLQSRASVLQTMPIRLLAKVPRTWFGRLKVGRQRLVFRGFHFAWFSQAFIA